MKRTIAAIAILLFSLVVFSGSALAQRNIEPKIERDPVLEQDAKHNLEVAWQYFKLKKAYKAVLGRYEETAAAYPEFSKIDEFLYIAGMSSYYLSDNKGKQKIDLKTEKDKEKFMPEKLREDAVMYLKMMLEKNPESKYRDEAEKTLKQLEATRAAG
ncbi:MAG TPA: outer membrane protein assembly factor BamD [Pyrinomonadaceae bacterium]|nr:outer membrane protein assembly factor BamD [Pyrinomonadaceae bacterium]